MAEEKIVILGGGGMLGTDVSMAFRQQRLNVEALDLPEFDITDEEQLRYKLQGVQAVINCAAYTNVEEAEDRADMAFKINAEAVGKLAVIAKKAGIWVLHVSTDFVFDGKSDRPYVETDVPNPINVYGKSKLAGEQLLAESGCRCCVVRIEWTYGYNGTNFVNKLLRPAKNEKQLKVVDDQIGSPTATTEAAKIIYKMLEKRYEGLVHFANSGYVSRFEMARFVFDKLDIDAGLSSCKSSDFVSAAQRPLNSCFNCGKIKTLLGETIENWQVPLERFIRQL